MTVANENNKIQLIADGTVGPFPYNFRVDNPSDLVVIETDLITNTETVKILTTQYTVSGIGVPQGGSILFTSGQQPANGKRLTIKRRVQMTQGLDLVQAGDLPSESLEQSLDKLTHITQQNAGDTARALKIPESSILADTGVPDPEAVSNRGKFLRARSNGLGFELVDLTGTGLIGTPVAVNAGGTGSPTGFANIVFAADFATLEAAIDAIGAQERTLLISSVVPLNTSRTTPKTLKLWRIGAGQVSIASGQTLTVYSPDNILAPPTAHLFIGAGDVQYTIPGVHYPDWYGATGDGIADDTLFVNRATAKGGVVALVRKYKIMTPIKIAVSGTNVIGYGTGSQLIAGDEMFAMVCIIEGTVDIHLRKIAFLGSRAVGSGTICRGVVFGTNTAMTLHSTMVADGNSSIENCYFLGTTASTGHHLCVQTNPSHANTRVRGNYFLNIMGVNSQYGYGIIIDGDRQLVEGNWFIPAIAGQGRHATYFAGTSSHCKVIHNWAQDFQYEGMTQNILGAGGQNNQYIGNTLIDCNQVNVSDDAAALLMIGGDYCVIADNFIDGFNGLSHGIAVADSPHCKIYGNTVRRIDRHGIQVNTGSHHASVYANTIDEWSLDSFSTYVGVEIKISNFVQVFSNTFKPGANGRVAVRKNTSSPTPTNCKVYDNDTSEGTYHPPSGTNPYENITTNDGFVRASMGVLVKDVAYNPPSLASNGTATGTLTSSFTGAQVGDPVILSFSLTTQGITFFGWVASPDTINIALFNATGGTIDLAAGTVRIMVFKTQLTA